MNIWKRYSMRVSKNWVKFNKMFTLSPWVPTEDQLLRMVERGHLSLMIGTDCQVDYALSQRNDASLMKADYRPPHPVVLYLGMSKHSPHHALGPVLAQALQAMVESGEVATLAKPYQP